MDWEKSDQGQISEHQQDHRDPLLVQSQCLLGAEHESRQCCAQYQPACQASGRQVRYESVVQDDHVQQFPVPSFAAALRTYVRGASANALLLTSWSWVPRSGTATLRPQEQ